MAVVLVDMDNTIMDFDGKVIYEMKRLFPDLDIPVRKNFYIRDNYPEKFRNYVEGIYKSHGFYASLDVMSDAKHALNEMIKEGHQVFICTSSLSSATHSISEKYESWIRNKFGEEWAKYRLIVIKDKTLVNADFLIDDRPEIRGLMKPVWQHILFDQPYNQHIDKPRLKSWNDWRQLIIDRSLFKIVR